MNPSADILAKAVRVFRRHGGSLRTSEALRAGIHPRTFYAMRDRGLIERLSRGLYQLADAAPLTSPDLITVALKTPDAVVCLVSALACHNLTTQIPHAVYIAVPTNAWKPEFEGLPVEVFEFGGKAYSEGVEVHELDGVPVRIYSAEKTLADCFKYRNKIGLDVAIEALKLYAESGEGNVGEIMRYARICRVANVMRPYLEAML